MSEVKITIEGEGLSLTKHTTLQKAGQIISFLGVEHGEPTERSAQVSSPILIEGRLQPRDVIFNSNAKTYAQKIAALANYLRERQGHETFSPQEIRNLFKKIGDEPRNFSRDFNEAIERQYLNCVDASTDQYELTDKGIAAVQNGFSEDAPRKKTGSAKKTNISKGIREEIKKMEFSGTMEGYPNYHDLPTKADKILWLLEFANQSEIKTLTPVEVEYISTELRERIEAKGFTALNGRNIRNAFVIKGQDGFRNQKKGSDYLKGLVQTTG